VKEFICYYCEFTSLNHLKSAEKIDCFGCENLTTEGTSELGHVKEFICCFCNFTSLNHLKSAEKIDCSRCDNLTQEGISELKNVKIIK
jgi:hypothetical protein